MSPTEPSSGTPSSKPTYSEVPFTELCEKHLCDKIPKWGHGYSSVYAPMLEELARGKDRVSVLEIGTGNLELMTGVVGEGYRPGAGARVFRDFLRDWLEVEPVVFTVDISLPALADAGDPPSIYPVWTQDAYCQESASDIAKLMKTEGLLGFDLIVDDGSHREVDQMVVPAIYEQLLLPGGRIVIEDIGVKSVGRHLLNEFAGTLNEWINEMAGRPDNRMWVSDPAPWSR